MNNCNQHSKCINSALEHAQSLCNQKKILFTSLRKNILEIIWQSHIPLKAYDLLERLQKKDSSAKPITVYRTLDFLLLHNLIHKLESQNTYFGCTHPGDIHNCYFLICKKCNQVEEGCEHNLLKKIYETLKESNFIVDHAVLEIKGICKSCQ
ncbi:MAG: transcriptional repressor [Rickettsiales bacterium]